MHATPTKSRQTRGNFSPRTQLTYTLDKSNRASTKLRGGRNRLRTAPTKTSYNTAFPSCLELNATGIVIDNGAKTLGRASQLALLEPGRRSGSGAAVAIVAAAMA